ncbi:MAG: hypothetical protein IMF01_09470 [Proteobacteria bacterium]|nr:hypothetical protein [Pseudomonadota bacterium]
MKVGIYKDNEHKDTAIVFYSGISSVLYAHCDDDISLTQAIESIQRGIEENSNLLCMQSNQFYKKKTFICSMEIYQ